MTTIARLGFSNRPITFTKALAYTAKAKDVIFYSFTPKDIDYEQKKILGTYFDGDKWKKKLFPYPDYIYDRVLSRGVKHHKLYEELGHIPFNNDKTPGGSISKEKVYRLLEEGQKFKKHLITFVKIEALQDVLKGLEKYGTIICKSATGSRGLSVHYFEKLPDEKILMKKQKDKTVLSMQEFKEYVNKNIVTHRRNFILQPFIKSITNTGNPFDLRSHVMKNGKGKWSVVKTYPRIGLINTAISNMHIGGSTCDLKTFLTKHITVDDHKVFARKIRRFSIELAEHLESLFEFNLCEIGLDIAVDEQGDLWIFEVNVNQVNLQHLRFEAAEHVIDYGKYLVEEHKLKTY